MTGTGKIWDASGDEYRADGVHVNQSSLKTYADDPELFRQLADGERRSDPPGEALLFGLAVEAFVFYGQRDPVVKIPNDVLNDDGHRKGKVWNLWRDQQQMEHGSDVRLLKSHERDVRGGFDYEALPEIRENVRGHSRANHLIESSDKHVRITFEIDGFRCKAELDGVCWDLGIIVDLKTTRKITERGFSSQVEQLRYYLQAFWYQRAVYELTGDWFPMVFVAVHNKPSYRVETFELADDWYLAGEHFALRQLELLGTSLASGKWTTSTHGKIVTLPCPGRVYR